MAKHGQNHVGCLFSSNETIVCVSWGKSLNGESNEGYGEVFSSLRASFSNFLPLLRRERVETFSHQKRRRARGDFLNLVSSQLEFYFFMIFMH